MHVLCWPDSLTLFCSLKVYTLVSYIMLQDTVCFVFRKNENANYVFKNLSSLEYL